MFPKDTTVTSYTRISEAKQKQFLIVDLFRNELFSETGDKYEKRVGY